MGATTVTRSTVPSASSSAAIRSAKVVFPAPGVATARKSVSRRRRYSTMARRCQARSGGKVAGDGRTATTRHPPLTRHTCKTPGSANDSKAR